MAFVQPIRRILLVALDNLGDLVFASALTPPLHAAFPDATIDVWCKEYTAPIAPLIPHINDVIAADPFWAVPPHRPRPPMQPFLRSVAEVRRRRYDVAVVSEAPWRTAAAVAAARIPVRVGLARHHNNHFLTHVLPAEDARKPVVQEQARLLEVFSIAPRASQYRLETTRLSSTRDELAAKLPTFVALHPFATDPRRCVAMSEWIEVGRELEGRGFALLWIGTTAELSAMRASKNAPSGYFIDQFGDGSLTTTAAALSLATIFIGHDSGPLHLASAFGTAVVGVFAPGQPERTFPQGIGESRMIYSPTPDGITAERMLREINGLLVSSAP